MAGVHWQIGDHVLVRGMPWTIREAAAWPDCTLLRLMPFGERSRHRTLLTPFDRPTPLHRATGTRVAQTAALAARTAADWRGARAVRRCAGCRVIVREPTAAPD